MNYSKFRITLDIHRHQSQVSIPVMYGDTAVQLLVTLSDGGTPYVIGKSCWAQFVAEKPDNSEPLLRKCIIENETTIRLDFDNGIADVAGVYDCEIRLYGAEGILTSPCFTMVVDPRVVADNVGDDMAANGFIDQIGTAMAEFQRAEEAREEAEQGRAEAEEARVANEEARKAAETRLLNEISKRLPVPTGSDEGRFLKASGGKIVFSDIGDYQFPKLRAPLSVTVDSRGMTVTVENRDAPFILKNRIYLEDEEIATIEEGATADFSAFVGDRVAIKVGVTAVADGFKESDKIFARWGLTNGTEGLTYSGQTCTGIGAATESEIEIASYHNGDPVLYIAIGAFRDCTALTSVKIPNTVEDIGRDAFHGCTALKSIIIPESVTDIHNSAFYGCKSLESITMSNIKKYVGDIGNNTFYGCEALKSITIPYGATYLGDCTFKGCSSLTSVTIPDSVTTIYSNSFDGCTSLTNITIPDSVIRINSNAFRNCKALTSITIPGGVKTIGSYTFYGCTALTDVTISEGVEFIDYYAFESCSSLTSITIPASVTNFSPRVFLNCGRLKTVIFKGTPTSIASAVFENCASLTDIYVPWSEGEVANAPWGATNATIHYNTEV